MSQYKVEEVDVFGTVVVEVVVHNDGSCTWVVPELEGSEVSGIVVHISEEVHDDGSRTW